MMGEVQQTTINWLMVSVAIIIFFIFLPFILKALKSNKRNEKRLTSSDKLDTVTIEPRQLTDVNKEVLSDIRPVVRELELVEAISDGKEVEKALSKTRDNLFGRIKKIFQTDEHSSSVMEDIEEILYTSDIGPQTVVSLMGKLDEDLSKAEKKNFELVKESLKKEILHIFSQVPENNSTDFAETMSKIKWASSGPTVVMIVGVNGAGKTTTIGKLSAYFAGQGKKILVAAGDTFRAAAQSQLKVWTDRAQVEVFAPEGVNDPSAVAFDAVAKAKAQNYDLVLIDTAGRLHTQTNLMEELKKVKRVIQKNIPESPHEVIIVLDANSGQNALIQAKEFHQSLGVTGVVLTKMDGTAKGGVAIGITNELKVPIKLIGVGEKISDLKPFSSIEYVESIFS
ncbi:MAG: signal recognition particle-docking protein FtsY [Bdellovibrionaceae bacterium]|nr:signal recognition particle-docking protein FtsY [Pseudobdellovibrionaceae bacterium]